MRRASRLFNDDQRRQINEAIARAEGQTRAEIVPVVVTSSGRYDRPEDVVGLWVGVIAMAVVYVLLPPATNEPGSWGGYSTGLSLVWLVLAMVGGFVVGALVAGWVPMLRRIFTPNKQMRDEVQRRATQAFFDKSIHHTTDATGVLIFVSLFERRAVVLADQRVVEAIGQPALDEACAKLTSELATAGPTAAICDTVTALGEKLAPALPRQAGDVNEHPDELVTID